MFYPPPPLSPEEFQRRVDAGARTFAEIDPEFMEALEKSQRFRAKLSISMLVIVGVFVVGMGIIFACSYA